MYQKILVPVDRSKHAEAALLLASQLAGIHNAEIVLLHVMEYPFEMYSRRDSYNFAGAKQADQELQTEKDEFYRAAKNYLEHLASMVETPVSIEVQECPVVDAILSTTEKSEIDLIVMSSIGEDRNQWMVGSITNRILRKAQVPVILISKGSNGLIPDRPHKQKASIQKEAWSYPGTLSY
jgi:nucleotide-binding universal stress UspA family protein